MPIRFGRREIPGILAGGAGLCLNRESAPGASQESRPSLSAAEPQILPPGDVSATNSVEAVTGLGNVVDAKKTTFAWTQDDGPWSANTHFRYQPTEAGSAAWFQGVHDFGNTSSGRHNHAYTMGWNLHPGPTRAVGGNETAMGLGFEAYYNPDGNEYMEHHLYFVTINDVQRRPWSWLLNRKTGEMQGAISGERFTFSQECGGVQTMVVTPSAVTLGRFRQLPVVLRAEHNDVPFLVQRSANNNDIEIARVDAADNVVIASGGAPTRVGGALSLSGTVRITTMSIADLATGGNIGPATTTVDLYSSFNCKQTTQEQTLSLPAPTIRDAGLELSVSNVGSVCFTILGTVLPEGCSLRAKWTGTVWSRYI